MPEYYIDTNDIAHLEGFEDFPQLRKNYFVVNMLQGTGDSMPNATTNINFLKDVKSYHKFCIVNIAGEANPCVNLPEYQTSFFPYYEKIHEQSEKYYYPLDKIILFTSNLNEQQAYDAWRENNNITAKFHIWVWAPLMRHIKNFNHEIQKEKPQKKFLCLNKGADKFKHHRTYLNYLIHKNKLQDDFFLSFDPVTKKGFGPYLNNKANIDYELVTELSTLDPVTFLTDDDFIFGCPKEQVSKSLVSIVTETHHISYSHAVLDYTEKTFKPILWKHPLLIFGAELSNTSLEKLGFKSYEGLFGDLNWDSYSNQIERHNAAFESIKLLNQMSIDKLGEAVNNIQDIIDYNYNYLVNDTFYQTQKEKFIDWINEKY